LKCVDYLRDWTASYYARHSTPPMSGGNKNKKSKGKKNLNPRRRHDIEHFWGEMNDQTASDIARRSRGRRRGKLRGDEGTAPEKTLEEFPKEIRLNAKPRMGRLPDAFIVPMKEKEWKSREIHTGGEKER